MNDLESKSSDTASTGESLLEHEYDGIREYDNPLPRWWVWIFWGSFHFAFAYLVWYHVLPNGTSVKEAYNQDMSEYREWLAKKQMGEKVTEEGLASLMKNDTIMADASGVFTARCVQCHSDSGQGKIGPNLTDGFWIHGEGKLMDIYGVVSDGVQAKGMPSWSRQLTPMELSKVVAFVGTLRGKNLPGKAPEGKEVTALVPAPGALVPAPGALVPAPGAAPALAKASTPAEGG